MSSDEGGVRRPRVVARPEVGPGPLRELKDLLYRLYLEAEAPALDQIAAAVAADDGLAGAPERDTVRRIIGSAEVPASQQDAVAVAVVLAGLATWDPGDVAGRVRELWVQSRLQQPLGRPIVELTDPFDLEVHRAIDPGPRAEGLPLLPVYVPRYHDARLRAAVDRAVGGVSGLVMLVGGSSTGKTRACWEAVHRLPDGWRVWHPIDPGRPQAAAEVISAVGPRTVVWLNEAQHYLLTPGNDLGERVAAGLRELLRDRGRAPVLVLGTIWPDYWAALTADPTAGKPDPCAQARALLAGASIEVPEAFTGTALDELHRAAARDPRLAQACEHAADGRISQYLAGGPALLDRYRTAPPPAKALIQATMDARRLGHELALPHALLEAAAAGYLSDDDWDGLGEDWMEQALAYTAAPCKGTRGPLTRIRPRPGQPHPGNGPYYRLADYLEQFGRTTRATTSAPAVLWDAFLAYATPTSLPRIARQAVNRWLLRHAHQLYQRAAEAGDGHALRLAAYELAEADRTDDALAVYQRAAEAGDRDAWRPAAQLLERAGQTEEAITAYQRAAEAGDILALDPAAELLTKAGRTDEALRWLQDRAQDGHPVALRLMAKLLERAGQTEEAITAYQRAAEAGDILALDPAAELLTKAGRTDEAVMTYQTGVRDGNYRVIWSATALLNGAGRTDEAINWLRDRAQDGHPIALPLMAEMLERAGRTEEAITTYQRAAEAGVTNGLRPAADLLAKTGRADEAISWLQTRAEAGDTDALRLAAWQLALTRRTDEAISWLQTRIDAGDTDAVRLAAELLANAGRTDEAISLLQARGRDAYSVAADLLAEAGRTDEAISLLHDRAQDGNIQALWLAAWLLAEVGRTDEAIASFQRAAEAGHPGAMRPAADLLARTGQVDEAEAVLCYGLEPGARAARRWIA